MNQLIWLLTSVVVLSLAALRYGADSRDSNDWRYRDWRFCRLDKSPSWQHTVTADLKALGRTAGHIYTRIFRWGRWGLQSGNGAVLGASSAACSEGKRRNVLPPLPDTGRTTA